MKMRNFLMILVAILVFSSLTTSSAFAKTAGVKVDTGTAGTKPVENKVEVFKVIFDLLVNPNEFHYSNLERRWAAKCECQDVLNLLWSDMNSDDRIKALKTCKITMTSDEFAEKYLHAFPDTEGSDQFYFSNSPMLVWLSGWEVDQVIVSLLLKKGLHWSPLTSLDSKKVERSIFLANRVCQLQKEAGKLSYGQKMTNKQKALVIELSKTLKLLCSEYGEESFPQLSCREKITVFNSPGLSKEAKLFLRRSMISNQIQHRWGRYNDTLFPKVKSLSGDNNY